MAKKNFHILLPVWGTEFTKQFLDVSLPMLFALGNIKADERHKNNLFVIITTYSDAILIRSSESFKKLQSIMPVHLLIIDGLIDFSDRYTAMTQCYELAMQQDNVIPGKTYFIFITADCFYTANTFDKCFALAEQDYWIALMLAVKVNVNSMTQFIQPLLEPSQTVTTISTPDLICYLLKNIHQIDQSLNWFSKTGFCGRWTSKLFWINEEKTQMVAHCFHIHPMMIKSPDNPVPIGISIDESYLENLQYPLKRQYVFEDNYFCIDLAEPTRNWDWELSPCSKLSDVVQWANDRAKKVNWHYFKYRITLNGTPDLPINPDLDCNAKTVVKKVLSLQITTKNPPPEKLGKAVALPNLFYLQKGLDLARKIKRRFVRLAGVGSPVKQA